MIKEAICDINDSMATGFDKLYGLLELREKTVEYEDSGQFAAVPFDQYGRGGYWRKRSAVTLREERSNVACEKRVIITIPTLFVMWYNRVGEESTADQLAEEVIDHIHRYRTSDLKTSVRKFDSSYSAQKTETGKTSQTYSAIIFEVDFIYTKTCDSSCVADIPTVCPELCDLIEVVTWPVIKDCMDDTQIEAAITDLCEVTPCDPARITLYNTTPTKIDAFLAPSGEQTDRTIADSHHTVKDQFGNVLADVDIPATESEETVVTIEQTCSKLINGVVTEGAGTPGANGTWIWNVDEGQYENENGHIVQHPSGVWLMEIDRMSVYVSSPADNPWSAIWSVVGVGVAPAPSFTQATEPCTVTFKVGDEINGYATWEDVPVGEPFTIPAVNQDGNAVVVSKNEDGELEVQASGAPSMTVDFEATPTTANVGDEITFTDESTGTPIRWCWDVNDNQFSTEQNPSLIPLFAGYLTIQLQASGGNSTGGFEEKTNYLAIGGLLEKVAGGIGIAPFRLYKDYTGALIRVRRAGVPIEVDIAQDSNGKLDEAALLAVGDSVQVNDYYDQGGGANWENTGAIPIVIDGIIQKIWNRPAPYFGYAGNSHLYRPSSGFWGANDRTQLFIAVVLEPAATGQVTHYVAANFDTPTNDRSWGFVYNNQTNRLLFRYSLDGTTPYQEMFFDSLQSNESAVITVSVNTLLAADDRVKMTKNSVAMPLQSRNGDLSGQMHLATADITLGCVSPTSPAGFYSGKIGGQLLFPFLPTPQQQADIAEYLEKISKAP